MRNTTNLFERELVAHLFEEHHMLIEKYSPTRRILGVNRSRFEKEVGLIPLTRICRLARKIRVVVRIAVQNASPTLVHNRLATRMHALETALQLRVNVNLEFAVTNLLHLV